MKAFLQITFFICAAVIISCNSPQRSNVSTTDMPADTTVLLAGEDTSIVDDGSGNIDETDRADYMVLAETNSAEPFEPVGQMTGIGIVYSISQDEKLEIREIGKPQPLLKIDVLQTGVETKFIGQTSSGKRFAKEDFRNLAFVDNPDCFTMVLECTDTTGDGFYTVIADQHIRFKAIVDSIDFKFLSWPDFITQFGRTGLDFDRSSNPVRNMPDDNATVITHKAQGKFPIWICEVKSIQGDWIQVRTILGEDGWIRWRKGKEIVVSMDYVC